MGKLALFLMMHNIAKFKHFVFLQWLKLFFRLQRSRAVGNLCSGLNLLGTISGTVQKLVMGTLK